MKQLVEQSGRLGHVVAVGTISVIAVVGASLWLGSRQNAPPAVAVVTPAAELPAAQPAVTARPDEIGAYLAFLVSERSVERTTGNSYAAAGLRKLAAVLVAEGRGALWRERGERLEEAAARIDADRYSHRHAGIAREAFLDLAGWIPELMRHGNATAAPAQSTEDLIEAAESIRPQVPLREQKPAVERFFEQAAAALAPSRRA